LYGSVDEPLSFNRYLYSGADPANLIDPRGLSLQALSLGLRAGSRIAPSESLELAIAIAGTLLVATTVALGYHYHQQIIEAAMATSFGLVVGCAMYIAASQIAPSDVSPPAPWSACAVPKPPANPANDNAETKTQDIAKTGEPTNDNCNEGGDAESGGGRSGGPIGGGGGDGPGGGRSWLSACRDMCSADTFDSRWSILANPKDKSNFLRRLRRCGKGELVPIFQRALNMTVVECRNLCWEYFGQ
jgi:hypothetical protein